MRAEEVQERNQDLERGQGSEPRQTQDREARLLDFAVDTRNMLMRRNTETAVEEGSTNVYAHPGYAEAAEMQRKS